jgi:hypothetical protein
LDAAAFNGMPAPQGGKASTHQSIKTVKQQNENTNEMILTYNRPDINGRDVEKLRY